jgi:hypothetical protein
VSILEKPAGELTESDYETLSKKLGSRVPYPMMGMGYVTGKDGKRILTRYLGVLEKPLTVTSERDLDDVEGLLIRNMPTPEMLPVFYEIISALDPRNDRRAVMFKGAPGAGKTFLGEIAGKITSEKGAIKVDCTDMNLNELFFETVLDFNSNQRFYDALSAKIEKYNEADDAQTRDSILNPMSVDILEDSLGKAFSRSGNKISIDWENVKTAHDGEMRENIERAITGLKQVSAKEGLDASGGNALGMATQEGMAWQAYKEGRVLILDEINRAKRGTFGVLHGWMQFVIGEISECRVRNPLKEKGDQSKANLHFTKEDMASGHFVYMTGNLEDDSDEVLELPEALSSRVVPQHIPKATTLGWQHRICQILTGIPVSTLYHAQSDVWEKDPEEFTKKLLEWRGLRETKDVPEHQINMLHRWRDILEATEHLADFLESAGKAVDPDSDWHQAGTLTQLLDDISDSFKREMSVDFRKITFFMNKAFQAKPNVRPPQGENAPDIQPFIPDYDTSETQEDIRRKLGTNMTYVILDWIIANSFERGKEDLGHQLMKIASDCALIDPQLIEGMPSSRRTFSELLDENPFENGTREAQSVLMRDLMCDQLRHIFPDIAPENEDIMSASVMLKPLDDLEKELPYAMLENSTKRVYVFNTDPDSAHLGPLNEVYKMDAVAPPPLENMVTQNSLLTTLAAPHLRETNLLGLWDNSLSDTGLVTKGEGHLKDKSLMMAENDKEANIAVTTVSVKHDSDDRHVPLHIIWNKQTDRLLVVSDGDISDHLKKSFNDARVIYVNREQDNAQISIKSGLRFVAGAEGKIIARDLRGAIMMRNHFNDSSNPPEMPVSEILVNAKLHCHLPQYLTKTMS